MVSHWQSLVKRRVDYHRRFAAACPYGRGSTARNQQSVNAGHWFSYRMTCKSHVYLRGEVWYTNGQSDKTKQGHTLILQFSSSSTFSSFRSLCTTPFCKLKGNEHSNDWCVYQCIIHEGRIQVTVLCIYRWFTLTLLSCVSQGKSRQPVGLVLFNWSCPFWALYADICSDSLFYISSHVSQIPWPIITTWYE